MKVQHIKASFLLVAGAALFLTGCLKDEAFKNGQIQSVQGQNIPTIYLGVNVQGTNNFTELDFDSTTVDTTVDFLPVRLVNGNDPAPQDIHVTIAVSDSVLAAYNTAHGTSFIHPASVTVVNPMVTIQKGTYQAFVQVKFKPSDLIGVDGALGFAITGVQESGYTISGNYNTGVISISVQ